MNKSKYIIWLTGASGVGKTTLLSSLKEKHSSQGNWEFLKFDSIGVPSTENMVKEYGSGENWQRAKTYEWIEKMVSGYPDNELVVMDGQANLDFIKTGFEKQNFNNYQIILVDCEQEIMIKRLVDKRQQAWLASDDMKNWLRFLRKQAQDFATPIIDTSHISPKQVVEKFEEIVKNREPIPTSQMTSSDVIDLYNQLENIGIKIWIDGGWSVDALLGRQMRPHKDLDIAMEWKDVPELREFLGAKGYKQIKEDSKWNFVLADSAGRELDVHAFVYDNKGNVVDGIMYPAESLTGTGTIKDTSVRCISAKYMVEFLAPWLHKWPEKYLDAVRLLSKKFNIDLPKEYLKFKKHSLTSVF